MAVNDKNSNKSICSRFIVIAFRIFHNLLLLTYIRNALFLSMIHNYRVDNSIYNVNHL